MTSVLIYKIEPLISFTEIYIYISKNEALQVLPNSLIEEEKNMVTKWTRLQVITTNLLLFACMYSTGFQILRK